MSEAKLFRSDSEFRRWREEHPQGFVINCRRELQPDYIVLHLANCASLMGGSYEEGALTSWSYRKIGGDTPEILSSWIAVNISPMASFTKRCGLCRP